MSETKPGYKHTPLGWIPEEWEIKELSKVAEIQQGISKGKKIEISKMAEIPYMRVANIKDGFMDLSEIKTIQVNKNEYLKYLLKKEDILITEGGDLDKLGRGAKWNEEVKDCIYQNHLFRIRTLYELSPDYFFNYLQSKRAKTYFLNCAKQTTGIASINSTQVKEMPVIIPEKSVQNKIAAILSTWDEAITKTQQLIAQLQQRNKGLMQQLLKPKENWQDNKLSDIFDRITRKNTNGNVNVITISAQRGFVKQNDFFKNFVASQTLDNYFLVQKGEFCYNESYSNGYDWGATKRLIILMKQS